MSEYGEELSERELDVLRCVARGASNKEAAIELHISENTVKVHLRRVFSKLGVSSRTEATRVAIQQGLVIIPGLEVETPIEEELPVETISPPLKTVVQDIQETLPGKTHYTAPIPAPRPSPRPFSIWRLISLVLAGLLILVVVIFINLQLQNKNTINVPEPFAQTSLGDDWVVTNRPLPVGLADMAVASVGLSVYAVGGETADGIVDTLYRFDTSEHFWQRLTPKPTAVAQASAAELFGEIYVVGGRLADGQPSNVVEVYSPAQNAWRPVTSLPQPISGGTALSDGSFLYLFGGWNGTDYLDTTYVYDPAEDSWRPLDAMSQARALATGQFMLGQLYVVGGFDGEQELDACEFFDPALSQWFTCSPLLLPRGGGASAVVLNKLYVIGGGINGRQETSYSEQYDPNTQTWQVVNTPLLDDVAAWKGLGVANIENRIFVLGGYRGQTLIGDTYIYSPFVFRTYLPSVPIDRD